MILVDLLDTIDAHGLVDHVAPIQLAIRLLIPRGSRLLELDEVKHFVGAFDPNTLAYPGVNADPRSTRCTGGDRLVGSRSRPIAAPCLEMSALRTRAPAPAAPLAASNGCRGATRARARF